MHYKVIIQFVFGLSCLLTASALAQSPGKQTAIYSGIPLFDDRGKVVSAHGANIIRDNGRFYLFGEAHTDSSNAFVGFNCYSSSDLYNWKFESVALTVQPAGKLGPNRVGERPKVMKCPETGEYVMYMHVDTLGYINQFVGYATSKSVAGPYSFQGPLLFNGSPIKKWDMGAFQDRDGLGYVLLHGGDIYKLASDYRSISEHINKAMIPGFESPTIFNKDSIYYFLGSNLTSWERNDNYYFTASSLKGPWTSRGLFAPKGSLTWNSQCTFVLPIDGQADTTFMYMGDRWSFPKQASAATYVWQPLKISETSLSIPDYQQGWQINTVTGRASSGESVNKIIENTSKKVKYKGLWMHSNDPLSLSSSDKTDASFSIRFKGKQIGFHSLSKRDNGYAQVILYNSKGQAVLQSIVDMYCLNRVPELKFLSPVFPKGKYTLTVTVMGQRPNWSDKRKSLYGSTGNSVVLDKIVIN